MTDLTEIVARLRAEAEDRRHLDLPMTVKPCLLYTSDAADE